MLAKIPTAFKVEGKDFDPDRLNLIFDALRDPALDLYDLLHPKKESPG